MLHGIMVLGLYQKAFQGCADDMHRFTIPVPAKYLSITIRVKLGNTESLNGLQRSDLAGLAGVSDRR
jgi:hypothetical protein